MKLSLFTAGLFFLIVLAVILSGPAAQLRASSGIFQEQKYSPPGTAVDLGVQAWSLYSKKVDGGFLLDRIQNKDNFGPDTKIMIAAGASALWIAARPEQTDFELVQGIWNVVIITEADWGISGSLCQVEVGIWNGRSFERFDTAVMTSNFYQPDPLVEIRQKISQNAASVVAVNRNLAIKITNLDRVTHEVQTAENGYSSVIQGVYPSTVNPLISPSPFRTAATLSAGSTPMVVPAPVTTAARSPAPTSSAPNLPAQASIPVETPVSLMGGIMGIVIAMVLVTGFFLAIILVSRFLVKRRKTGSK
ncbi:MAG TPA: hypothetical protein VLH15_02825 [Dehalococcoidales bacterium]|nr:hypothetical protein [Dehalococcoidales bacterium]